MKLTDLHEGYIRRSQPNALTVPSQDGFVTIRKSNASVPLIPTNKWVEADDKSSLSKRFEFRETEQRNRFVCELLEYETQIGHSAGMHLGDRFVELRLTTHDLGTVTELDAEYSSFADTTYRDICYNP